MRIVSCSSMDEAKKKASAHLKYLLQENKDTEILLLLSGGSALTILGGIQKDLSRKTTISVLDERFAKDPRINNFSQITQTKFYSLAKNKDCGFIDTRVKNGESHSDHAERFERDLREWKSTYPNGIIVATQGIGEDGHTSGIMPFPENPELFDSLFNGKSWVISYDAGEKNPFPFRSTTTLTFLRIIDHSIVLAVGDSKKAALEKALSSTGSISESPARIIQEMKNVVLFTDSPLPAS
jgi:6-phosphogluconolactonase/glucosamine-6-phosphate isomerase/deaminase